MTPLDSDEKTTISSPDGNQRHPIRKFLAALPAPFDRVAWLGLPNFRAKFKRGEWI
jgi:hypothetical protein